MKIEEAKDAIKVRSKAMTDINAINSFGHIPVQQAIPISDVIKILDQLDQPKLKIPQFMLDWVDDSREHGYEFDEWFYYSNQPLEVYKWLNTKNKRQKELNALALVTLIVNGPDAVTVEKEKLYTVEILDKTLVKVIKEDGSYFYKMSSYFLDSKMQILRNLTESEIKEADERLWQWAKEVTE